MRLFVGIPVPEDVGTALARCARQTLLPGARLTPVENLHLTLYFLGEVASDALTGLRAALDTISAPWLTLSVHRLGTFPRVGVLFAEVDPDPHLAKLQHEVARAVSPFALRQDRNSPPLGVYHPHITLARSRSHVPEGDLPPLPAPMHFHANRLHLYESRPAASGSRYIPLHTRC